jgi:hypothetical protein
VALIQVDQYFPWTLAGGGSEGGAGHRKDSRSGYRLEKLATGLGRVCPDFNAIWCIGRL